ncbi:hypothetical protein C8F01DRAFT_1116005 [Mycena amicta]|nr:hypothetical protein C8F01DRAFT_1116005 [Mycena amicta]
MRKRIQFVNGVPGVCALFHVYTRSPCIVLRGRSLWFRRYPAQTPRRKAEPGERVGWRGIGRAEGGLIERAPDERCRSQRQLLLLLWLVNVAGWVVTPSGFSFPEGPGNRDDNNVSGGLGWLRDELKDGWRGREESGLGLYAWPLEGLLLLPSTGEEIEIQEWVALRWL